MGGGHGHGSELKIPDYRVYTLENCPQLLKVQKDLAALGLKDPWLRNEAWRYNTTIWGHGTFRERWGTTMFRGSIKGFVLAALTVAGTYGYDQLFGSGDKHGHGEHH